MKTPNQPARDGPRTTLWDGRPWPPSPPPTPRWPSRASSRTCGGYSGRRLLGVGHRSAEVAKPVWERRSSEVAQTAVVGLYPAWDINSDAVAAADTFLAEELPPALRRLVIEGKAGVERALRAREFDAGG